MWETSVAGVSVPPLRSPDECSGSRVESADAARSSNTESAALSLKANGFSEERRVQRQSSSPSFVDLGVIIPAETFRKGIHCTSSSSEGSSGEEEEEEEDALLVAPSSHCSSRDGSSAESSDGLESLCSEGNSGQSAQEVEQKWDVIDSKVENLFSRNIRRNSELWEESASARDLDPRIFSYMISDLRYSYDINLSKESDCKNAPWKASPALPTESTSRIKPVSSKSTQTSNTANNLYKTELCNSWIERGVCRYGSKCQFAHGEQELRPVTRHPKYKTEICRTYTSSGTCPYGSRCRFIHDDVAYQKRRREQLEQESSDYVNTSYVIEDIRLDKCSVKESGRAKRLPIFKHLTN